jgi:parvulin-like peptidyl-prolyl isomerase
MYFLFGFRLHRWIGVCFIACFLSLWIGCSSTSDSSQKEGDVAAQVGGQYLYKSEVHKALSSLPKGLDSLEASKQFINQWVTTALMANEAENQNLQNDEEVKKRIEDSRRSVLMAALLDKINKNNPKEPTPTEIATYFTEHKDQLVLREPYVCVRYLQTQSQEKANAAYQALQIALQNPDTVANEWARIVKQYADDSRTSLELSDNYIPESRLTDAAEPVWQTLQGMSNGQVSNVLNVSNKYHVLQLVERLPEGSTPKISWIQNDIREILRMNTQKQAYLVYTQDLKSKALSKGVLKIQDK